MMVKRLETELEAMASEYAEEEAETIIARLQTELTKAREKLVQAEITQMHRPILTVAGGPLRGEEYWQRLKLQVCIQHLRDMRIIIVPNLEYSTRQGPTGCEASMSRSRMTT